MLRSKLQSFIRISLLIGLLFLIFPSSNQAYTDLSKYIIKIGPFPDKNSVNSGISQLRNDTGWTSSYELSDQYQKYQIISGGFTGETRIQSILEQFEAETRINADYEGSGEPENYLSDYQRRIYRRSQNTKHTETI